MASGQQSKIPARSIPRGGALRVNRASDSRSLPPPALSIAAAAGIFRSMKYVVIIPDGAADTPLAQLQDRTPFEAAQTPHTDALSMGGRQGTVATTPGGMPCGSDVCSMSVLGYDPLEFHQGRAPIEAAAMGLEMGPSDWVFRVNLVTVIDGLMQDHSAGQIRDAEGKLLIEACAETLLPDGMSLYPGVSYRNIMIDRSGRDWAELATTAPHDILGKPIAKNRPVGSQHVQLLQSLIDDSAALFAEHEVNLTRAEIGESPATHLWPWGQGVRPTMPAFADRFGKRGAMITAVDLLAGIGKLIGFDVLDVPDQTSYHDTDYAAAGRAAIEALDQYDLVCVHVEAPDEAAHSADAVTKVAAIEAIDQHITGPIHKALGQRDEPWRMLLLPDHYTCVDSRQHDPTPVPFVMAGQHVVSVLNRPFTEANSQASDLHIAYGHELMEYFLFAGLT